MIIKYFSIFYSSVVLNFYGAFNFLMGRRTFVFQMHSINQYFHVAELIKELKKNNDCKVYILLPYNDLRKAKEKTQPQYYPYECTLGLIFYSVVYGLDQRMKYPFFKLGKSKRVCGFHGQPTKGNAFIGVSKRIDEVFLYGSSMKEIWLRETVHKKALRSIKPLEIGQCKTDEYLQTNSSEYTDSAKRIVIAPSFESCSLLYTYFEEISSFDFSSIGDYEILFKPHPASLKSKNPNDTFFKNEFFDLSKLKMLKKRLNHFPNVDFLLDSGVSLRGLLRPNTVLITDYSGIAFDALLLKTPVLYLFDEVKVNNYFSEKYNLKYKISNAFIESGGASKGYKVNAFDDAIMAAIQYEDVHWFYYSEYVPIQNKLLYNPGNAIKCTISELYGRNQ